MLLVTLLLSGEAQGAAPLMLAEDGGQPGAKIVLAWHSDEATLERPLELHLAGTEAIDKATLKFYISQAGARVAFEGGLLTASGAALGPLSLKQDDGPLPIKLRITKLAAFGELQAQVVAQIKGERHPLGAMTIVRPAQPTVTVTGAQDGVIRLSTAYARLHQRIQLRERAGHGGEGRVSISISPLHAEKGSATLTPSPADIPLKAGLSEDVFVTGSLPTIGVYSGKLTLRYGEPPNLQTPEYQLVIERTAPVEVVELDITEPVIASWRRPACVSFTVREKNGRMLQFSPQLGKLRSNAGAGPQVQDAFIQLAGSDCHSRISDASNGAAEKRKTSGHSQPDITLPTGEVGAYGVNINNITEAGAHRGEIEINTPNGVRVKGFYNLQVRRPWWHCVLLAFLGALAASALTAWKTVRRPHVVQDIEIRLLLDRLARDVPDPQDRIRAMLQAELERARAAGRVLGLKDDIKQARQATEARLNNYLLIRHSLSLRAMLPELIPTEQQRLDVLAKMKGLQSRLDEATLSQLDDGGELVLEATKLDTLIAQKAKEALKLLLGELAKAVADALEQLKGLDDSDKWQAQLREIASLQAAIKQARDDADSDHEQLREHYDAARARWEALSAELAEMLSAAENLITRAHARLQKLRHVPAMADKTTAIEQAILKLQQSADGEAAEAARKQLREQLQDGSGTQMGPAARELAGVASRHSAASRASTPAVAAIPPGFPSPDVPLLQDLTTKLRLWDYATMVLQFVVAVGASALLLWSQNPTWGSHIDMAVAFVFGFGLAGAIDQVLERFGKAPTIPGLPG